MLRKQYLSSEPSPARDGHTRGGYNGSLHITWPAQLPLPAKQDEILGEVSAGRTPSMHACTVPLGQQHRSIFDYGGPGLPTGLCHRRAPSIVRSDAAALSASDFLRSEVRIAWFPDS